MKHNWFEIKVSDILNSIVTDTIPFENKKIAEIENLTDDGITWAITIQSIDHESLLVTLDLECELQESCDRCWTEYLRKVSIEWYTAKYVTQIEEDVKDDEDEILLIDVKNWVIDIEELIYHAIQLQEPFVKYCEECEKLPKEDEEEW